MPVVTATEALTTLLALLSSYLSNNSITSLDDFVFPSSLLTLYVVHRAKSLKREV